MDLLDSVNSGEKRLDWSYLESFSKFLLGLDYTDSNNNLFSKKNAVKSSTRTLSFTEFLSSSKLYFL